MDATSQIKALCSAEGFVVAGVASAANPPEVLDAAINASREGRLAGLGWMTPEWLTRAADPTAFLPGARSVVVVALPYARPGPRPEDGVTRGRVAGYAAGRDYHRVFEKKLRRIAAAIRNDFGADARATVDYGPLLERPLAARAGAGWLGKSTMLLVPGLGPWNLLGAIATSLELEPDPPLRKSCGSCARCVTACPTGALSPDGRLDARLCISYHTIENRGAIPAELRPKFKDWLFGCDDCLTSCPVGSKHETGHRDLAPKSPDDAFPDLAAIIALDESGFAERFRGRAVARAKREGLVRNACVVLGNIGSEGDLVVLQRALTHDSALVRGHAAWALGELARRLDGPAVGAARSALAARRTIEHDATARDEIDAALARLAPVEPRPEDHPHGHRE